MIPYCSVTDLPEEEQSSTDVVDFDEIFEQLNQINNPPAPPPPPQLQLLNDEIVGMVQNDDQILLEAVPMEIEIQEVPMIPPANGPEQDRNDPNQNQ